MPRQTKVTKKRSTAGKAAPGPDRRSRQRPPSVKASRRAGYRWSTRLLALAFLFSLVFGVYLLYLDNLVQIKFDGKRWSVPARVYGRPLDLYAGARIGPEQMAEELIRLGYRKLSHPDKQASWSRNHNRFLVRTRPFTFWDGSEPERFLDLRFDGDRLAGLYDAGGAPLALVRLEAPEVGSIYPSHNEDRILISKDQLPELLVKGLLAVEDRSFYSHHGVDPKAILRALWANLRAGGLVQGGSTLTQQLIKNLYLTQERTLWRKLNEAAMAVILDARYAKDEIMGAYANEIYLGQDGSRAIHGFGLASRFYFNRPLAELDLPRLALLVGMIRGPSLYDPRRHPERAKQRRDKVLEMMLQQGAISEQQQRQAVAAPLGIGNPGSGGEVRYPAFLTLVRRQLHSDYREEDLTSEGLRIFTTLDPWVQEQAEKALSSRLDLLEKAHKLPAGKLEGAVVVAATGSGEVLAVVSGRRTEFSGFNRALDAVRPIGSLIKPVVYLAALMQPQRYTLTTRIADAPVSLKIPGGKRWTPQNYDRTSHGRVTLFQALTHSYNLATVNLGLDVGLEAVSSLLADLGISRKVEVVPALLLGALSLPPLEVAQLYQTLAAGGFHSPLRAIREVQSSDGIALQRYPLTVRQSVDQGPVYLLNRNLQEVVRSGTGRALSSFLSADLRLAGKTGTTDELRDSWFAGFDSDRVAVVWVGRDDNSPAGLSGSQGAMRVWGDLMRRLKPEPLLLPAPASVDNVWVDTNSGLLADENCANAELMPYLKGSAPVTASSCVTRPAPAQSVGDFFRGLFE
ncbi:MAG: penicillin-binding protein 1B [Gammaproteobacteria bacterium]|nr:penicillin-binding protein 1B [Gammaproteobacteria bacterium]MCB1903328.1 penicillin-binding protein 1B [Gammaproteobacteria bacterium]